MVVTVAMPTLAPILRARLMIPVPMFVFSRGTYANAATLIGMKRNARPKLCNMRARTAWP